MIKKLIKHIVPKRFYNAIKNILFRIDYIFFKSEIKKKFYKVHGYKLNIRNPRSLNEKIIWKKLYDRNPLIVLTTDKFKVRKYVEEKLGKETAARHLIPLLYYTEDPAIIPFSNLPDEYIIKPNHGSQWFIISENNNNKKQYIVKDLKKFYYLPITKSSRVEIIELCKKWLNTTYGIIDHQWAYSQIKPVLIIEKLLRKNEGGLPDDYRFMMFHQKCKVIYVSADRLNNLSMTYYDTDWNILNITRDKPIKKIDRPQMLESMITLAEKLSADFDFARIDFFNINENVYFGEITHYPVAGFGKITPVEFDFELGKYWKVK